MEEGCPQASGAHRGQGIPVWPFSSGPLGDPPHPVEDPVDVAEIVRATSAEEQVLFAGKADRSRMGFADRAVLNAVKAPDGDFRDWDGIAGWAERIATRLRHAEWARR